MPQPSTKSRFEFTGGNLCLNFTNTVNNRRSDHPRNLLNAYSDLVSWGREGGLLTPRIADRLSRLAEEAPGNAKSALNHAIHLREAIYIIFCAVVERRGISGAALQTLNTAVQQAAEHAHLTRASRQFTWEWISPEDHLDSILWPVSRAAADLLTSTDLGYVRQCAASDCAWLFVDKTKNHRRRWCEMKTCGNRDKARRYYERQKA